MDECLTCVFVGTAGPKHISIPTLSSKADRSVTEPLAFYGRFTRQEEARQTLAPFPSSVRRQAG
jgi:hypothetical protein